MGFHAVGGGAGAPLIELHAPTSSIEKLKLIGKCGQSPLTCRLSPGCIHAYWSVAAIILINAPAKFELETSGFDTILSCMHQPVQPINFS
jgi:hypothetical protein